MVSMGYNRSHRRFRLRLIKDWPWGGAGIRFVILLDGASESRLWSRYELQTRVESQTC